MATLYLVFFWVGRIRYLAHGLLSDKATAFYDKMKKGSTLWEFLNANN